MQKQLLSLIIPCFNEQETLGACLEGIRKADFISEAIVVDDGSSDDTANVAKSYVGLDFPIKIIQLNSNSGKSKAVQAAASKADGNIIIVLDADMVSTPTGILKFYNLIATGQADIVIGSRFLDSYWKKTMPLSRRVGNFILAKIFCILLKQKITDVLCGFKAFKKSDFLQMKWSSCRWGDLDILAQSKGLGLKVVELPVTYLGRNAGKSKMRPLYDFFCFSRVTIGLLCKLQFNTCKK